MSDTPAAPDLDLDAWMAEEAWLPDLDEEPPLLDGREKAEQYAGALVALRAKMSANDELHTQRVQRLDAWLEEVQAPLRDRSAWLERAILGWVLATHRADPRVKTVKLPAGTLSVRPAKRRVEERDATDAVLDVLADLDPGLVSITRKVARSYVPDIASPGAVVEGAHTEDGYEVRQAVVELPAVQEGEEPTKVDLPGVVFIVPKPDTKSVGFSPAKPRPVEDDDA